MKPEAQRIAIAEWCGWRVAFPEHEQPHPETKRGGILLPYKWVNEITHKRSIEPPDCLNELNAMHEAVSKLNFGQDRFIWWMEQILKIGHRNDNCEHRFPDYLKFMQSTAAQRAEALLRTIGKWTD